MYDDYLGRYILVDRVPRPERSLERWANWMESADRHVADTQAGGVRVSTIFLGLNHCYGDGPPLLFETMVFGGPMDQGQWRTSTWEQAEAKHAEICDRAFGNNILRISDG